MANGTEPSVSHLRWQGATLLPPAWAGVPTQWWRLLRHPDIDAYDLSLVRTVGSGGAVFPPELVRELHARFPEVRLGNGYGMSETVGLEREESEESERISSDGGGC